MMTFKRQKNVQVAYITATRTNPTQIEAKHQRELTATLQAKSSDWKMFSVLTVTDAHAYRLLSQASPWGKPRLSGSSDSSMEQSDPVQPARGYSYSYVNSELTMCMYMY